MSPGFLGRAIGGRPEAFRQPVEMGDVEAHFLHRRDDGARRRGAAGRHLDGVPEGLLHFIRGVDHHVEHDRRPAHVGDGVLADQLEDRHRVDAAQTDVGAAGRRHAPGVAPAVAMEHRQRPQVHRLWAEPEHQGVAERVEESAAVVIDDALGVAGGARRVVQRDRLPFVGGRGPSKVRIAFGQQRLVIGLAQRLSAFS